MDLEEACGVVTLVWEGEIRLDASSKWYPFLSNAAFVYLATKLEMRILDANIAQLLHSLLCQPVF